VRDDQQWYVKLDKRKNYKNPRLEWVVAAYDGVTIEMMRIARANKPQEGPVRWLATCIEKNLKSMTTGEDDMCIESTQISADVTVAAQAVRGGHSRMMSDQHGCMGA
jgi:hypothetical protein